MTDTQTPHTATEQPPEAGAAAPSTGDARPAAGNRHGRRGGGRQRQPGGQRQHAAPSGRQAPKAPQAPRSTPTLETLADLYPALFGATFLPLKRGIYEDLVAAHPEAFKEEELKEALALHTRSSRYLTAVASGLARHDLLAQPVEPMAPEHVYHALTEVFRRRQGRSTEDLSPKLRERIITAFEQSGMTREAYAERMRGRNEAANAVLDAALAEAASRHARDEALLRAFDASGQSEDAFAGMYGLDPQDAARTLARARARRTPA